MRHEHVGAYDWAEAAIAALQRAEQWKEIARQKRTAAEKAKPEDRLRLRSEAVAAYDVYLEQRDFARLAMKRSAMAQDGRVSNFWFVDSEVE